MIAAGDERDAATLWIESKPAEGGALTTTPTDPSSASASPIAFLSKKGSRSTTADRMTLVMTATAPKGETTRGLANPNAAKLPISPTMRPAIATPKSVRKPQPPSPMASSSRSMCNFFCKVSEKAIRRLPATARVTPTCQYGCVVGDEGEGGGKGGGNGGSGRLLARGEVRGAIPRSSAITAAETGMRLWHVQPRPIVRRRETTT